MKLIKSSAILLTLLLTFSSGSGFAAVNFSDSLVTDLSCDQLSVNEIYNKMRPEAFSSYYHLPVRNWGFSTGLYDIAACWSLAHAQRLSFYLARWEEPRAPVNPTTLFETLEMFRGSSPYAHIGDPDIQDFPVVDHNVFSQAESTWSLTSPLWLALKQGFTQSFPNDKTLYRNFKSEIEAYQNRRFHDFIKNIRYIIGDGTRTPEMNLSSRNQLIRNLEENKLTLLLLRPKRVSQHVVLAKRFMVLPEGDIEFQVYDSNAPGQDRSVTYKKATGQFYAPEIIHGLPDIEDPQAPLGVFLVDEGDRSIYEKTLLTYYQRKCQSLRRE